MRRMQTNVRTEPFKLQPQPWIFPAICRVGSTHSNTSHLVHSKSTNKQHNEGTSLRDNLTAAGTTTPLSLVLFKVALRYTSIRSAVLLTPDFYVIHCMTHHPVSCRVCLFEFSCNSTAKKSIHFSCACLIALKKKSASYILQKLIQ